MIIFLNYSLQFIFGYVLINKMYKIFIILLRECTIIQYLVFQMLHGGLDMSRAKCRGEGCE